MGLKTLHSTSSMVPADVRTRRARSAEAPLRHRERRPDFRFKAHPARSMIILGLDTIILYALTVHGAEFAPAARRR
jgi:hypothetical protein